MAMQTPGAPSLAFLFYLLFVLPWMAFQSSRKLGRQTESIPAFSDSELERIWYSTILNLSMMFGLAWAVGSGFGFEIFALPQVNLHIFSAVIAALSLCFLVRAIARHTRPADERQKLVVFALAPRTRRQWFLKTIVILAASIAEESAYRGVGWAILSFSTDNDQLAAFICCLAFALAHWIQGWRSLVTIGVIAGIMHALVFTTQSLVPAMIVHGTYDFIAVGLIALEASQQRKSVMNTELRDRGNE